MQPSLSVTTPLGPIIVTGAEPAISPDSRTGGFTLSVKESVREISTCEALRTGPKTRTFSIGRSEGPILLRFLCKQTDRVVTNPL